MTVYNVHFHLSIAFKKFWKILGFLGFYGQKATDSSLLTFVFLTSTVSVLPDSVAPSPKAARLLLYETGKM